MSSFVVSARKYRPVAFPQVFGQGHITTTLEQAIKNQRPAQAMLFCGPRGVGKTTCARIFAHQINSFDDQDPTRSTHALNIFELDAASNNSVEDIRNLTEQVRFPPQQGKYKIYIIDEVHMLSQQAFNAFLKTLEEPPAYALFILATTEKQKILPTVLSRCQIFHFKRILTSDIVACLQKVCKQEKQSAEEEALYHMARQADGSIRDALSLFDMLMTFSQEKHLTYEHVQKHLDLLESHYFFKLTRALAETHLSEGLCMLDEAAKRGVDLHHFLLAWSEILRDLLLAKDLKTDTLLQFSTAQLENYQQESHTFSQEFLLSALEILNTGEQQYKQSQYPRLHVELLLAKISRLQKIPLQTTTPTAQKAPNHSAKTPSKAPSPPSSSPTQATDPATKTTAAQTPVSSFKTPSLTLADTHLSETPAPSAAPEPPKAKPTTPSAIKPEPKPYTDQEKLQALMKKHKILTGIQERFQLKGEL